MKFLLSLTYSVPCGENRREFTLALIRREKTASLKSAFNKFKKAYTEKEGYDWTGAEPVKFEQIALAE